MSVSLLKYFSQPHVYLGNLRNIATILGSVLIPVAITISSRVRERKRATLDLLRRFTSDKEITERLERLYQYRQFEQGASGATNPFTIGTELISESVLLLNLCDTIAIEVEAGLIDRIMLYRALGPTLIGAREVVMTRLERAFGMNLGESYGNLEKLVGQIRDFQRRKRLSFVTRIPTPTMMPPAATPSPAAPIGAPGPTEGPSD